MKCLLASSFLKIFFCVLSCTTFKQQIFTHNTRLSTDNLKIVSVPDVITDGPPNVVMQYFPSLITCTISEKKEDFTKFMKIMKIIIYYFEPLYN